MGFKYNILGLFALLVFLTGCGGGDSFRINGTVEGMTTQNLNVIYYGDGSFRSTRTAALDGKFMFEGKSRDLTPVYIFTNSRMLLGIIIIKNGETVNAKFEMGKVGGIFLEGNKQSEQYSKWLRDNAEVIATSDSKGVNEAVKEFIYNNGNSFVSTVLMMNYYRPGDDEESQELLRMIDAKARPAYIAEGFLDRLTSLNDSTFNELPDTIRLFDTKDTLRVIATHGKEMVLYSPNVTQRDKKIDDNLKKFFEGDTTKKRQTVFIEIDRGIADTAQWKRGVRSDSLPWDRMWHPVTGGMLFPGKKTVVIVADTSGRIIYRGEDISPAVKELSKERK